MVKRLLNLAISSLFAVGDWVITRVRRLLGQAPASRCIVLAYHSVSAGERSSFARQMDVLLRLAKPVPADLGVLPSDGAAYAAVTFDDGFQNIVDNALPELRQRQIPSTLFIVTESLGTNRAWEHRGGDDTRDEQVMSAEQLSKIEPELVSIGSHTMTHSFLPSIDTRGQEPGATLCLRTADSVGHTVAAVPTLHANYVLQPLMLTRCADVWTICRSLASRIKQ